MPYDFKKEVLLRKDEIIKDLQGLIQINSELTTFDPNRKQAPFGKGIDQALSYMLELGKKDGFDVENVDHYAGHIRLGSSDEYIGSIGHLDVVPAGTGWTYPAYSGTIVDGKMYGRGTEDDKGPTIAFYYAMKILKQLKVPLSKEIKLVLGTDEETAWRGVAYYFSKYPKMPVAGFIPDADFPLIYAEKGITRIYLNGQSKSDVIDSIEGGLADNMVPESASVRFKHHDFDEAFDIFLEENNYEGKISKDDDLSTCTVFGKSAHGSLPHLGHNAIDRLFEFLKTLPLDSSLVQMYDQYLLNDWEGQKLGIAYTDEEMGPLTNNIGKITYDGNQYQLSLNLRYPHGVLLDDVMTKSNEQLASYKASLELDKHHEVLYFDPQSDLVQTLMSVYKKHTGEHDAKPINIGGGTFARVMQNTVAFGPHFLDKPTFIHQKDEYVDLDDFFKAVVIYTEALYELAK